MVQTHQYDPFGQPQNSSDSRFRYTGQILIEGTELYYYKARIYHPKLGRFLQTDPVGYEDQMNLYAYVGNDPINMTDPTGKFSRVAGDIVAKKEAELRQAHWDRNENNNNNSPDTEFEAKSSELGFEQLEKPKSVFHMQGEGGEQNKKYISEDGRHEAVYDGEGNLVTDDLNKGTYNFADPINHPLEHGGKDVVPYFLYGNGPKDPTTIGSRIKLAIDSLFEE